MIFWLIVSVMFVDPSIDGIAVDCVASAQIVQLGEPVQTGLKTLPGYVDPGTGSLILQGLLAGIITALALFKGWFAKIRSWLKRDAPVESDEEKNSSDEG